MRYRLVRNMQSVHLRGLEVSARLDLIPGYVDDGLKGSSGASVVRKFFFQNGFVRVDEVARGGRCE